MAEPRPAFRGTSSDKRRDEPSKRPVNLSVDSDLLNIAKEMRINLSQVLEEDLRVRLREERIRRFQEQHRDAIEAHNRFIEEHGIWSKKYRSW